jgi:hypothetical protein
MNAVFNSTTASTEQGDDQVAGSHLDSLIPVVCTAERGDIGGSVRA